MRLRLHVAHLFAVLALVVGMVAVQNASVAMAAPYQSATGFDAAIASSFEAVHRALVQESCQQQFCGYDERIPNGPLTGYTLWGGDSWYNDYPLPDYSDCSGFIGYDCWRVYSITYTQPSTKSGYLAYVSTENDGNEECSNPTTNGWKFDMSAYASVSYASTFSATSNWTKGQYLGGDSTQDECFSDHHLGLNMSHWINVNNNWTWWNTGIEAVA